MLSLLACIDLTHGLSVPAAEDGRKARVHLEQHDVEQRLLFEPKVAHARHPLTRSTAMPRSSPLLLLLQFFQLMMLFGALAGRLVDRRARRTRSIKTRLLFS
jgi:hypothetical protein